MFKKSKRLLGLCLGVVLSLGVGVAARHQGVINVEAASGDTYTFNKTSDTATDNNWKYETAKNQGSSNPAFTSNELRLYPKNTITFTALNDCILTKATFTNVVNANKSKTKPTGWSTSVGTITTFAGTLTTFTVEGINASSFTITINGSAGNVGLKTVKMEYTFSKTLSSITASLTDASKSYYAGETLLASDFTVTPNYDDGTSGDPINDGTDVTLTNPTLVEGSNTVIVSYGGVSTTVDVTAKAARTITSVTLDGDMNKKSYYEGDAWDVAGLYLTLTWSVGENTTINLSDLTKDEDYLLDSDTAALGDTSLHIEGSYNSFDFGKTVTGINVSEKPIQDVLTDTIVGSQSATYTNSWALISGIKDSSGATYAIRTMKPGSGNGYTMNTNKNGYFVTTSCPANTKVQSLSLSFLTSGKSLNVYGSNNAFTSGTTPSETYLAQIDGTGAEITYTLTANYRYIAFKGTGSSTNIGTITITYVKYTATDEAKNYAQYFNTNIGCDSTGVKAPTGWSKVKTQWSNISTDAQAVLKNVDTSTETDADIVSCITTYEYIVNKYNSKDSKTYNDFMGRGIVSANASNAIYRTTDNNTAILIVVLVSFTSITAIGGYFFIRKRRFN